MKHLMLVGLGCVLPVLANASACQKPAFLQQGFDMQRYAQCQQQLKTCPQNGPAADIKCVEKIAKDVEVCRQFSDLSAAINGSLNAMTVTQAGKFALVEQTFLGDGQHAYYIISPKGCLVNTNVDLKKVAPALAKQYKNVELLSVNWNKPVYAKTPKHETSFDAVLKVTKSCLACEVLGYGKVKFTFNQQGELTSTKLVNFSQKSS